MFRNHLLTALRAIRRAPFLAALNILGLAIGTAGCLLVFHILRFETSVNQFHAQGDRIYRVLREHRAPGHDAVIGSGTPAILADKMSGQIPGVEGFLHYTEEPLTVRIGSEISDHVAIAPDGAFFTWFDFPLLAGDPRQVLVDPRALVVSHSFAQTHLGEPPYVGRELELNLGRGFEPYLVTGVMADMPERSTMQRELVIPYQPVREVVESSYNPGWGSIFSETFVLLEESADPDLVEQQLNRALDDLGQANLEDGQAILLALQPFEEMYLSFRGPRSWPVEQSTTPLMILISIGLLILFIAWINFTTLATGRSLARAHEVGVRKVLGARRRSLVEQFLLETGIIVLLATLLGVILAQIAMPAVAGFMQKEVSAHYDGPTLLFLLLLILASVLGAGFYPASVITGYAPMDAFRGSSKPGGKQRLRRLLVVAQFTISIALIAITLAMGQQLRYLTARDLGFRQSALLFLEVESMGSDGREAMDRLRHLAASSASIQGVSGSSCDLGDGWIWMMWEHEGREYETYQNTIGPDYLEVMGLELLAGRALREGDYSANQRASRVLINQSAADYFGWEDPIGQRIPGSWEGPEVVGMVRDFHFTSLHQPIEPLILSLDIFLPPAEAYSMRAHNYITIQQLLVRTEPGRLSQALEELEQFWAELDVQVPFDPVFADESVELWHANERRWSHLTRLAAGLAVLIAVSGVLGVALLEVVRRRREIGVRKVLGASTFRILALFTRETGLLVGVALLLAGPASWLITRRWLEGFAYQIELTAWPVLIAGVLALGVSWMTVSALTYRHANTNPADVLREE